MIYRHAYDTDMRIFAAGTHMHHVGVSMDIQHIPSAEPASSECLVGTPEWDFYQQRTFAYDQPVDELPVVQPGDELHLNCLYDNTLDNPALAASLAEQGLGQPVDVTLGDETRDEMCLGVFGVLVTPWQIDQFLVAR